MKRIITAGSNVNSEKREERESWIMGGKREKKTKTTLKGFSKKKKQTTI